MASIGAFLYFWVDLGVQSPVKYKKPCYMILNRFIKSGKSMIILVLICIIVFMGLMIHTQVQSQMVVIRENEGYKEYVSGVESWKNCMANTNIYTIADEKYAKLSEIQSCGN